MWVELPFDVDDELFLALTPMLDMAEVQGLGIPWSKGYIWGSLNGKA